MATIGLYDIDLWHRGKAVPNLELMQYYNYYHKNNHRVLLMKPTDQEEQFTKIIYFKENPNIMLPKTISVYGDKKSFTGYGFYKQNEKLPPEIRDCPPLYDLYNPWVNKLSIPTNEYEKMRRNSYIRIETENYVDLKPEANIIFIADREPFVLKNAFDFFQDNKEKYFHFLHSPIFNDEQTAIKFMRFNNLFNKNCIINFHCSEDFFYEYYKEVIFKLDKFEGESELQYQIRLTKIALWYKNNHIALRFPYNVKYSALTEFIIKWAKDNSATESFSLYYQNSNNIKKEIDKQPTELRLLLKQNPKTITRQNLDLKTSL